MPLFQFEQHALFYEKSGTGEPLLFIHGWNESSTPFRRTIAPHLEDQYQILTLDLPGFGKSVFFEITYESITRLISAFLEYMEIQSVTLAGFCLGGTFVLDFAITYPHMVKKLFLFDVTLEYPLSLHSPFTPLVGRQILRFFLKTRIGSRIASSQIQQTTLKRKELFNSFKDTNVDVSYHYLSIVREYSKHNHYKRVKKAISFDILCVEGEYSSKYVRESMNHIVTLLPNATLHSIKNAGHFLLEENPSDVVALFKGNTPEKREGVY